MRNAHETIANLIADLDDIDAYDKITFAAGFVPAGYLSNLLLQDELLLRLERLDYDAYMAYICGEEDTLNKYYRRREEVAQ